MEVLSTVILLVRVRNIRLSSVVHVTRDGQTLKTEHCPSLQFTCPFLLYHTICYVRHGRALLQDTRLLVPKEKRSAVPVGIRPTTHWGSLGNSRQFGEFSQHITDSTILHAIRCTELMCSNLTLQNLLGTSLQATALAYPIFAVCFLGLPIDGSRHPGILARSTRILFLIVVR